MKFSRKRIQGSQWIGEETKVKKRFAKKKKVTNAPGLKEQAPSWGTMAQPKPRTNLRTAGKTKDGRKVTRMQGATNASTLNTKTEGHGKA